MFNKFASLEVQLVVAAAAARRPTLGVTVVVTVTGLVEIDVTSTSVVVVVRAVASRIGWCQRGDPAGIIICSLPVVEIDVVVVDVVGEGAVVTALTTEIEVIVVV